MLAARRPFAAVVAAAAAVAAALAAQPEPLRVVVLADSAAQARAGARRAWPGRLEELLAAAGAAAEVLDFTAAGASPRRWREIAANDLRTLPAAVAIILCAGSDVGGELERTVATLQRRGTLVVLVGAPGGDVGGGAGVAQLAADGDAVLVDTETVWRRFDAVAGVGRAVLHGDAASLNDRGHEVMAHLVATAILGALHRRGRHRRRPARRDWSLPFVDLADAAALQVVVDREPGQYLGHPTTVLLDDGATMLAVYPKGHGRGAIVMKRSRDGGRTWSERLPTPASWATSQEVPTLFRLVGPGGERRLLLFSGLRPVRCASSTDDGATWSELEPVFAAGGIVTMSCMADLGGGSYLAMFHDDGRFFADPPRRAVPPIFTVYQTRTDDGGRTWSPPRAVLSDSRAHHCEPGVIRSPDGRRLALLLRENSRRQNSHVIFSDDDGATWSEPRELPGALTGDRHVGRYAPDGRLLVTFRDRALASPTWGDWVAWIGTFADLERGQEGQARVRLMDNHRDADCAYPGLELLPDGTFVTTTYGHWQPGEPPYIVAVRLHLDEVDRRLAATSGTGR